VHLSEEMKQHNVAYWAWTWVFHHHTGLCIVLQTIINLPLSIRKELLGLCRTQSLPHPGSFLREDMQHLESVIMVPSLPSRHIDTTQFVSMTLLDLVNLYASVFLEHLTASIVAHGLRIAPGIDFDDYQKMFVSSVSKELCAAVNRFEHAPLDFRSIFSADASHRSIPICSRLPPSEEVASDTYSKFCTLRSRLANRLVFPRGGSKTVGRKVSDGFWDAYYRCGQTFKHDGSAKSVVDQVTVDDCLRLYQETGGYPDGPVEVRSSWKYSQITPRVYYARGGDVQLAAQYMQEIVNILIDEFPEVHRLDRFSPPSEPLSTTDVEMIYDYSSFTSVLDAVIPFVDSLSQFFGGVPISILDPVNGVISTDLGVLFSEYNRVCNHYQNFDISRLSLTSSTDSIFQHTCGMLGIEGNIFLATLLHGIYIRFFAGLGRSKCVGDDARFHHYTLDGRISTSEKEYAFWVLSAIGVLNFDKLRVFEVDMDPNIQSFRYIKRPFYRDENIMMSGLLMALPSQIPIIGALDSFHTVIPTLAHPCRNVFKQIIRFLDTLAVHKVTIVDDRDHCTYPIVLHLAYLRRLLNEKDPSGDFSGIGRSSFRSYYRYPPVSEWGRVKYVDWVLGEIDYYERVRFPKYGGADSTEICDGRAGSSMVRIQSRSRSFLERMGFLKSEMMYDEFSVQDVGLDMFRMLLDGQYSPILRYDVMVDVPTWYAQIPNTL